jgi:nitrous oxidase accessory protein NosD
VTREQHGRAGAVAFLLAALLVMLASEPVLSHHRAGHTKGKPTPRPTSTLVVPTATVPPTPSPSPVSTPSPTAVPTPTATPTPRPTATPSACASSIQALVNAAPSGSTVTVPPCAYREKVTIAKPLTLSGYGATILGDPATADHWVLVLSDDVTVEGFTMRDAGTTAPFPGWEWGGVQVGGYHVGAVDRVTLRDLDLAGAGDRVISLQGGDGHRVLDSKVSGGGLAGIIGSGGRDWTFTGNDLFGNNTRGQDVGISASAVKILHVDGLTFTHNDVHDNPARGFWTDTGVRNAVIANNRAWGNTWNGLFLESSHHLTVTGNAVWGNTRPSIARPWGWGGGITLASSDHALVEDNVLAWNGGGVTVVSQSRTDDEAHTDLVIRDNVIVQDIAGSYGSGWFMDWSGVLFDPASANGGEGNRYWFAGAERYAWSGDRTSIATYNATPGEEGGSLLTTAQRDELLRAADVPREP